jgi:hypothetical protein
MSSITSITRYRRLVVLYFVIYVRELGRLVVLYFVIYVIEDLEG